MDNSVAYMNSVAPIDVPKDVSKDVSKLIVSKTLKSAELRQTLCDLILMDEMIINAAKDVKLKSEAVRFFNEHFPEMGRQTSFEKMKTVFRTKGEAFLTMKCLMIGANIARSQATEKRAEADLLRRGYVENEADEILNHRY